MMRPDYKVILRLMCAAAPLVGCGNDSSGTGVGTGGGDGVVDAGLKCQIDSDCQSVGATAVCSAGVCEDKVWGCIGTADSRPAATTQTATFKIALVDVLDHLPIREQAFARACPLPSVDPNCATPLPGVTAFHDPFEGKVTVSGLPQDQPFRLVVEPSVPGAWVPIDYYVTRPPRDSVEQEAPLYTFTYGISQALAASYNPPLPFHDDQGVLVVVYHDCQERWAAGVSASLNANDLLPDSEIIYFSDRTQPDPALTETTSSGVMVGINMPTGKSVRITSQVDAHPIADIDVTMLSGRVTFVHAYPRSYAR